MACARLSRSRAPDRTSRSLWASASGRGETCELRRHGDALHWSFVRQSASPPYGSRSGDSTRPDSDGSQRSPHRFVGPRSRLGPIGYHLRYHRPFRPKNQEEPMTTHIALFEPHAASDQLWAAFNETRRAIAREFWPDEPILDDAETRREIVRTNPLVEFRRWMAMEGNEVAGWVRAAFRRPGTPNEKDYARFLWAGGGVRASSRRRGVGTLLLREVHSLMHALDKSVLTMTAHTEPGHAFIRRLGAVEKHSTVEQRAVFGDLDWVRLRRWEAGPAAQGLSWERYAGRVPRDVMIAL